MHKHTIEGLVKKFGEVTEENKQLLAKNDKQALLIADLENQVLQLTEEKEQAASQLEQVISG